MSFIDLKSLKLTQKYLIFWNLLGVLISEVFMKEFKFILHSVYFLDFFRNHPKMFAIFEFINRGQEEL